MMLNLLVHVRLRFNQSAVYGLSPVVVRCNLRLTNVDGKARTAGFLTMYQHENWILFAFSFLGPVGAVFVGVDTRHALIISTGLAVIRGKIGSGGEAFSRRFVMWWRRGCFRAQKERPCHNKTQKLYNEPWWVHGSSRSVQ
jgi:hypothetical protein